MNKVTGVTEKQLISCFISGFKPQLSGEVRLAKPESLLEAFNLAKEYTSRTEDTRLDRIVSARTTWRNNKFLPTTTLNLPTGPIKQVEPTRTIVGPQNTKPKAKTKNLPFKKLNWREQQERRTKGLCFNYDEKFSATHDCKDRFMMFVYDDNIELEQIESPYSFTEVVHDLVLSGDISSLNSLATQHNPRSLRVIGKYNGKDLSILIDGGSTHNFVQPSVVEKLCMSSQPNPPFHLYIGRGDTLTCCKEWNWRWTYMYYLLKGLTWFWEYNGYKV